jgi:hypothetical protein
MDVMWRDISNNNMAVHALNEVVTTLALLYKESGNDVWRYILKKKMQIFVLLFLYM